MSYDPKEYPPFKNDAMQARVEEIGNSLVPDYQRALPGSDPAKIHFRFQVVDNKHFCGLLAACEAYAMPGGIIQVPHQISERMQNDSQLAAALADAIACILERQVYRDRGKDQNGLSFRYGDGLRAAGQCRIGRRLQHGGADSNA